MNTMMWLRTVLLCVVILVVMSEEVVDMTEDIIEVFLNGHNAARADVNLPPLEWSDELSQSAQEWASQCQWHHSDTEIYGENMFSSGAKSDVNTEVAESALKSWLAEIENVDPDWLCIADGDYTCGHYSQIVWEDTTTVGCSIVHCEDEPNDFVVCQYSSPGNIRGKVPYGSGGY